MDQYFSDISVTWAFTTVISPNVCCEKTLDLFDKLDPVVNVTVTP